MDITPLKKPPTVKDLETHIDKLRKAHSILTKRYHDLNKKYKSMTGKDFN